MELNNLGEKLVYDGSDKTRLRINLLCLAIGVCFFFAAALCLAIKVLMERQVHQELFFFLPVSAVLLFCGALTFAVTGIRSTYFLFKSQRPALRRRYLSTVLACLAMVIGYAALLFFLLAVNSGRAIMPIVIACAVAAVLCLLTALVLRLTVNDEAP